MSDGGHYYTKAGDPCYEVPKKDGGMRGINLRWDRPLGLVPSVTTVLNIVSKPSLVNWKVDQGILSALTLPRMEGEPDKDYTWRVKKASKQYAIDAAGEGTRIHDALERSMLGRAVPLEYEPHVEGVYKELHELYPGVNDWVPEKSFSNPVGYGGKVDLHSPKEGLTGDYKSKDGDFTDGKRLAYDQHWQLAAYRKGLCLPDDGEGFNIFASRTHPGKVASHVWKPVDMTQGLVVFLAALELWKAIKEYDSSFTS